MDPHLHNDSRLRGDPPVRDGLGDRQEQVARSRAGARNRPGSAGLATRACAQGEAVRAEHSRGLCIVVDEHVGSAGWLGDLSEVASREGVAWCC